MAINRELPPGLAGDGRTPLEVITWQQQLDPDRVMHHLNRTKLALTPDEHVTIRARELASLAYEVHVRRQQLAAELEDYRMQGHANALATSATKAIANVGHARPFEGHQHEATAIVQVANMLAELMQWRAGQKRPNHEASRDLGQGLVLHGQPDVLEQVQKLLDAARQELEELESARRIIQELERMGWLMKAAGK